MAPLACFVKRYKLSLCSSRIDLYFTFIIFLKRPDKNYGKNKIHENIRLSLFKVII